MVVIDGNGMVFGRLATHVAKRLLNGDEVALINAEGIVLSGRPTAIIEKFKARRGARNKATPEHSPNWPRLPHFLVKRMLRGMLPRNSARGKNALKRLMVFTGNPKKFGDTLKVEGIEFGGNKPHITIGELCKRI